MSRIVLNLTQVEVAVLLRCLSYGESAISSKEHSDGTADVLKPIITRIRTTLAKNVSEQIIADSLTSP